MSTMDETTQGTIRSGDEPTSRGGNDIDVAVSKHDLNAYWDGDGGEARWVVLRTGVTEFHDALANTYKWLEVAGEPFRIIAIRSEGTDKNRLLVTVVREEAESSAIYLK